jgi:glycogen operon protein
VEGDTDNPAIRALRARQARNCLAILMLSRGVPMLLAGDEVLRTQRGNNNAWCQDNEISWFDWTLLEANRDMLRFARELISLRRRHRSLTVNRFYEGKAPTGGRGLPDIAWHGHETGNPQWDNGESRFLAFTVAGVAPDEEDLHVMLNMGAERIDAALPAALPGKQWHLALDTSRESPLDIAPPQDQRPHTGLRYRVGPHSVAVLEARLRI